MGRRSRGDRPTACALLHWLPMMDGAVAGLRSILSGIGGVAGIAAFLRRRKSHTLHKGVR